MTYTHFKQKPFSKTLTNVVDEFISGLPGLLNEEVSSLSKQAYIPVNIRESQDGYTMEVVAPGFEKGDFRINLEDNILTIYTDKKKDNNSQDVRQVRREYGFRNFKRSFTIDEMIDATTIDASYVNGVLVLNLPKKKEVKEAAKEITVK